MSKELQRAKQRYETAAENARRTATANLAPLLDARFRLAPWTNTAEAAYKAQWCPSPRHADAGWDWITIFARHRNTPDRLDLVMWTGDRLSGLALADTNATSVRGRFLEGDPRGDCPLKGVRALIALEAFALYAQATGKAQLRIVPANMSLVRHYQELYGFTVVNERNGVVVCVKEV